MTQLTATFTVTIKTKPDGDYYFDHDDLVRNVVPWIEGGLDDRDDIAEVTITEQPAAVSAVVEPPAGQATPSQRAALRDRITTAISKWHRDPEQPLYEQGADAVLAVLYREWPWLRAEAEDAKPPAEAADRIAEETALSLGRDLLRDGLDAFLLRLVGPDNARRVLAEHRAADRAADAPATECSAQHRRFDDGRLCIRAAQHHGDHIDERGYHWSDTVAVYPVADGTFASRIRRDVGTMQRRMADETATTEAVVDLPERLEAALMERYTELGNPFSRMRRQEQGPDGWPAERPVGPHHVAEVLRELLATRTRQDGAQQDETATTETEDGDCTDCGRALCRDCATHYCIGPCRCGTRAHTCDCACSEYQDKLAAGARQDGGRP